ncbi:hypothetical protein SUGI_0550680 [Cryptomeria japonica]|nr:hypothetical protein SUGI_0550680 [Cryptomeria japonica]
MHHDLVVATKQGDLKVLQDIYGQNQQHVTRGLTFEGNSALHIAAREGHEEVVELILSASPAWLQLVILIRTRRCMNLLRMVRVRLWKVCLRVTSMLYTGAIRLEKLPW